jgi:hypothetical protein
MSKNDTKESCYGPFWDAVLVFLWSKLLGKITKNICLDSWSPDWESISGRRTIHPALPLDKYLMKLRTNSHFDTPICIFIVYYLLCYFFFCTCCVQYKGLVLMSGLIWAIVVKASRFLQTYVARRRKYGVCMCLVTCVDLGAAVIVLCAVLYTIRLQTCYTELSPVRWYTVPCCLLTHLVCIVRIPIFVTHCVLKYGATCCEKLYFSFIAYVM